MLIRDILNFTLTTSPAQVSANMVLRKDIRHTFFSRSVIQYEQRRRQTNPPRSHSSDDAHDLPEGG